MMIRMVILIGLVACICHMPAEASEYGVARIPAPVLNTPDFKTVFGGESEHVFKADRCGQVRELEFIALPGSVFKILKKQHPGAAGIYEVETAEYVAPPGVRLYVDGRFLSLQHAAPPPRRLSLPPREEIISALRTSAGSPYVWGGNASGGVDWPTELSNQDIGADSRRLHLLAGLDCSGLLYHATGGWTPRNTTQLLTYGQGVVVAGKSSADIAALLQPLDLIVWNGHVIIVLDRQTAIESRLQCGKPGNGGVVLTNLSQRLAEIIRTRHPANSWQGGKNCRDIFVVRRWYGF